MKNTAVNKFTIKYKKQYQMLQSRRKKKQTTSDRYQASNYFAYFSNLLS